MSENSSDNASELIKAFLSAPLNSYNIQENYKNINGLYYISNFLSNDLTRFIEELIEENYDDFAPISPSYNSRKVAQYGYAYSYNRSGLTKIDPIPNLYDDIINSDKIGSLLGLQFESAPQFNQLIINEYTKYQQIAPHVDHVTQFGPIIACISVGQDGLIVFSKGEIKIKIKVTRGSLYIMTGESRYSYKHSTKNSSGETRYSLTFRTANTK